jgi:hypothetical protein
MEWFTKGCEVCRTAILSGDESPLVDLGQTDDGWLSLARCSVCGSYWQKSVREAHVIEESEARETFPDAFANPEKRTDTV